MILHLLNGGNLPGFLNIIVSCVFLGVLPFCEENSVTSAQQLTANCLSTL